MPAGWRLPIFSKGAQATFASAPPGSGSLLSLIFILVLVLFAAGFCFLALAHALSLKHMQGQRYADVETLAA